MPRRAFIWVIFICVICASNQPCGSMAPLHGPHSKQSSLFTASSILCLFLILFLLWCFHTCLQKSPLLPTHLQIPQASTSNTVTPPPWGSPYLHSRIHPSTESITPSCHISCCQLHLPDFNMVPWEHRPVLLVSIAPHCLRGSRCSTKERRLMACSYCPHWSSHSANSSGDLVRSRCYRNHKTHFNILDQWADWKVNCLPACPLLWFQRPIPEPKSPVLLQPDIPRTLVAQALHRIRTGNHPFWCLYSASQTHHFQPLGLKGIQRRDGRKQCMPSSITRSDRLVWTTKCNFYWIKSVKTAGFEGWGPRSDSMVGCNAFSFLNHYPLCNPKTDLQKTDN